MGRPKMCRFYEPIAQSIPIPYYVIVLKAQGRIDLANRVGHLNARMRAGQNRCINNSPTYLSNKRSIELVFGFQNRTGVLYKSFNRTGVRIRWCRRGCAHTQFFCEFWAYAAYAKFS